MPTSDRKPKSITELCTERRIIVNRTRKNRHRYSPVCSPLLPPRTSSGWQPRTPSPRSWRSGLPLHHPTACMQQASRQSKIVLQIIESYKDSKPMGTHEQLSAPCCPYILISWSTCNQLLSKRCLGTAQYPYYSPGEDNNALVFFSKGVMH